MNIKNFRRSKAKLSCFNNYIQKMNDIVSSSEDEYLQTDYQPQVNLEFSDEEPETAEYDDLLKNNQSLFLDQFISQDDAKSQDQSFDSEGDKAQVPYHCVYSQDNQELKIKKIEFDDSGLKYQSYSTQVKLKQNLQGQVIKKKEQNSNQSFSGSPNKENYSNVSQNTTNFSIRKKNIFLTKDQKQKLQYDIKSQRFLLPDLIRKYKISRSTIKRYLAQINTYGEILMPNQKTRVVSGSKQNKIVKFIKQSIEKNPFLSQKQMALMIKQQMKLDVSQQTVSLILKKSNITKKKGMITYKQGNTDQNIEKRFEYAKIYQTLDENKVIFMDETGFNECFEVQYGYAPRGKRLLKQKSGKRGHKIVVILAITYDKVCHWDIVNFSVKTEHVASYIKKFSKQFRGYTLIMDNARVHKTHEVAEAVVSAGLTPLFLPPYSPQLNPIELVFGRLKTIYKSMMGIKLEQPEVQLSEKVNTCLKTLSESKLDNYKRPVKFWIKQAFEKRRFNQVVQQKE